MAEGDFLSAADLLNFNRQVQGNSLSGMASQAIGGWSPNMTTWSPTEQGIGSFGKTFLSALLGNYARQDASDQLSKVVSVLPQLGASPNSVAVPEGVDSDAFNVLKGKAALGDMMASVLGKQAQARAKGEMLGQIEAKQQAFANNPATQEPPPKLTDSGPDFGVEDLASLEKRAFQENVASGMPAVQAAASARSTVDELRKRSKTLITSDLAKADESIAQIEDIVRKGEEGIQKAGVTGAPLASAYESVASLFPWASEAKTQVEGDKLLDLTKNMSVQINRVAGSGALSDFESKALFAAGMSPSNKKEENLAILRNYKNGLAIAKDHQAFMNYYMDKTGGNPEMAQTMWDLYKEANPIIVKDSKTGSNVVNEKRSPWQKFDFKNAYQGYITGEQPTVKPTQQDLSAYTPQQIDYMKRKGLL